MSNTNGEKAGPRVLLEGGQLLPPPEDCKHIFLKKIRRLDSSKADEKFSTEIESLLLSSGMEKYPRC